MALTDGRPSGDCDFNVIKTKHQAHSKAADFVDQKDRCQDVVNQEKLHGRHAALCVWIGTISAVACGCVEPKKVNKPVRKSA